MAEDDRARPIWMTRPILYNLNVLPITWFYGDADPTPDTAAIRRRCREDAGTDSRRVL
jgi:hypothetical protein